MTMNNINIFIDWLPHRYINILGYSSSFFMTILGVLEKYNGVFGALIFLGIAIYFKWVKGVLEKAQKEQEIRHKEEEHKQSMTFRQQLHDQQLNKNQKS